MSETDIAISGTYLAEAAEMCQTSMDTAPWMTERPPQNLLVKHYLVRDHEGEGAAGQMMREGLSNGVHIEAAFLADHFENCLC